MTGREKAGEKDLAYSPNTRKKRADRRELNIWTWRAAQSESDKIVKHKIFPARSCYILFYSNATPSHPTKKSLHGSSQHRWNARIPPPNREPRIPCPDTKPELHHLLSTNERPNIPSGYAGKVNRIIDKQSEDSDFLTPYEFCTS